jgi:hypothetical protein
LFAAPSPRNPTQSSFFAPDIGHYLCSYQLSIIDLDKVAGLRLSGLWPTIAGVAFLLGVVLLTVAAAYLSAFHTKRIRAFQRLCSGTAESKVTDCYEIIPNCAAANIAVFFGLMSLVCAALIVIGYSI